MTLGNEFVTDATGDGLRFAGFKYPIGDSDWLSVGTMAAAAAAAAALAADGHPLKYRHGGYSDPYICCRRACKSSASVVSSGVAGN